VMLNETKQPLRLPPDREKNSQDTRKDRSQTAETNTETDTAVILAKRLLETKIAASESKPRPNFRP